MGKSSDADIGVVLGAAEPLFRRGMRAACEDGGLEVTGEFEEGAAAILADPGLPEAVVVVESDLLDPDAPATVGLAASRHRVLVVASGPVDKPRLMRAGASGFLPRNVDAEELRVAVRVAHAGDLFFGLGPAPAPALPVEPRPRLTRRETEVLRLLAAGNSTADIARSLYVGPSTVKAHLRSASAKLGVRNRAAATAEATRLGLI